MKKLIKIGIICLMFVFVACANEQDTATQKKNQTTKATATPKPKAKNTPTHTPTPTPKILTETPARALSYTIVDGEVVITGLVDETLDGVYIPSQIEGYPVVRIADSAFQSRINLEYAILPDSIREIGEYAFYNTGITKIKLPEGLKEIKRGVFAYCYRLESIYIPASVEGIQLSAFTSCSMMKEIVVAEGNPICTSRDINGKECNAIIYDGYYGRTLGYGCANTVIPDEVECLGEGAFAGCLGLTRIRIPAGIKVIDEADGIVETGVFQNCKNLVEIIVDEKNEIYTSRDSNGKECNVIMRKEDSALLQGCTNSIIPEETEKICGHAFQGTGIEAIYIPKNVYSIGTQAFAECSEVEKIEVDNQNRNYLSYDESGNQCNAIISEEHLCIEVGCKNTIFPKGPYNDIFKEKYGYTDDEFIGINGETEYIYVREIGDYAFYGCKQLSNVKLPVNYTLIDAYAFAYSSMKSFKAENGLESVGEGAFMGCSDLKEIELPATVSNIYTWAFLGCNNLTVVSTPKGSYVEQWAREQGQGYEVKNVPMPTSTPTPTPKQVSVVELDEGYVFSLMSDVADKLMEMQNRGEISGYEWGTSKFLIWKYASTNITGPKVYKFAIMNCLGEYETEFTEFEMEIEYPEYNIEGLGNDIFKLRDKDSVVNCFNAKTYEYFSYPSQCRILAPFSEGYAVAYLFDTMWQKKDQYYKNHIYFDVGLVDENGKVYNMHLTYEYDGYHNGAIGKYSEGYFCYGDAFYTKNAEKVLDLSSVDVTNEPYFDNGCCWIEYRDSGAMWGAYIDIKGNFLAEPTKLYDL